MHSELRIPEDFVLGALAPFISGLGEVQPDSIKLVGDPPGKTAQMWD